jgi:hypothetical protein
MVWAIVGALASATAFAQDEVEPPWGAPWANIYGTSSSTGIPVDFQPGGTWETAWVLDTFAAGANPPVNGTHIVFDADGNLYWHSQANESWADHVASCTPDGQLRWLGPPGGLGDWQSDLSPIVGVERVYMLGMYTNDYQDQHVFAISKADGSLIWDTILSFEPFGVDTNNAQPTPVLYNGKLYVMGKPSENGAAVYQIDAETGNIDFHSLIEELQHRMCGNTVLVPNAFGAGIHGIYVVTWDRPEPPESSPPQVFGIAVNTITNVASYAWSSSPTFTGVELGFVWWWTPTHVMYNPVSNRIYVYTEDNTYGYEFFSFDAVTGALPAALGDAGEGGHHAGYQTGAIDFDGQRVITGGWGDRFLMYNDDGTGAINYTGALEHLGTWDQFRQFIQLLQDGDHTIAVTATSGIGTGMTHALVIDLDNTAEPPAEDGPTYIDDVRVYQGPDIGNLTLVWSDDFEAYDVGELPPETGWVTMTGTPQPSPVIVEDPTGEGYGKVLMLDPVPAPGDPDDWYGHGVYHAFTQTTDNVIVTRYRQWREDTADTYEVFWGENDEDESRGFAYAYDLDRRVTTLEWLEVWNQPNYQIDRKWEEIVFTYDFGVETAAVKTAERTELVSSWIDPGTGNPYEFAPTDSAAGFGLFLWHTDVGEKWERVRANELVDVRYGYLSANLLGGPIIGPDGKMYYFESHQAGWDPPNECPGCLHAIQAVAECTPGDVNGDGIVNNFDISPFVYAITHDQATFESTFPNGCYWGADVNDDGIVNNFDISPFIGLL